MERLPTRATFHAVLVKLYALEKRKISPLSKLSKKNA